MNLLPITVRPEGSAAANVLIRCANNCDNGVRYGIPFQITWNEAAKEGWTWDREGEPYHAYYCEKCSAELRK